MLGCCLLGVLFIFFLSTQVCCYLTLHLLSLNVFVEPAERGYLACKKNIIISPLACSMKRHFTEFHLIRLLNCTFTYIIILWQCTQDFHLLYCSLYILKISIFNSLHCNFSYDNKVHCHNFMKWYHRTCTHVV